MLHERLDAVLENLAHDEAYRVVSTMGASTHETTEEVVRTNDDGTESGPFVRKRFVSGGGCGSVYRDLWEAQQQGKRFAHLPRVEECYELVGEEVVILEYVQGLTLHEIVYQCDPSLDLAIRYYPLICDAVVELHTAFEPPIIHRDLKPSNIIVSTDPLGRPTTLMLIDFGIARTFKAEATSDTTHFGTRAYAPPEQFGFGQTDGRSDQYALGMILYYLLTEEVPASGLAGGPFDDPRIPSALRPVLAKATAFDPKQRFADVQELKAAFMTALPSSLAVAQTVARAAEEPMVTSAPREPIGRLHDVFGIAWDVLLSLAWLFVVVGAVVAIVEPTEEMARVPSVLRFFEYLTLTLAIGGVAVMAASKAPLAKRIFALRHLTFRKGLAYGALFTGAMILLFAGGVVLQVLVVNVWAIDPVL